MRQHRHEAFKQACALLRRLDGNLGPHFGDFARDEEVAALGQRARRCAQTPQDAPQALRQRREIAQDEQVHAGQTFVYRPPSVSIMDWTPTVYNSL